MHRLYGYVRHILDMMVNVYMTIMKVFGISTISYPRLSGVEYS